MGLRFLQTFRVPPAATTSWHPTTPLHQRKTDRHYRTLRLVSAAPAACAV